MFVTGTTSFPEHMEIVFAGFRQWLVRPIDAEVVRRAMIRETSRLYAEKETLQLKDFETGTLVFGPSNVAIKNWQLAANAYYRMGGLKAAIDAWQNASSDQRANDSAMPAVRLMVRTLTVLHHYDISLKATPGIGRGGYTKAALAASALGIAAGEPGAEERSIRTYWKNHFPSLHLLYGAHRIRVGATTLFERLLASESSSSNKLTFAEAQPLLTRWLRFSVYGRKLVGLAKISKADMKLVRRLPGAIISLRPQPPTFDQQQSEIIAENFRAKGKDDSPIP
jgi:hypothetical protein